MANMKERTQLMLGEEGLARLTSAHVTVVGAGAVGGYVIEGLVRAGIGHLTVIDGDTFSESNLNRQVLATHDTIGRYKAECARDRALSINPNADVKPIVSTLNDDFDLTLIKGSDVIVDAIDTVRNKIILLKWCCENNIRTFSSMGAALHFDATSIRIAPLEKTHTCPVAAAVRKGLRDVDTSNMTCVFSEETPFRIPNQRDEHGKSVLGSLPTIPAIFGMTLANQALKYIVSL